jgi:uncharacterized protein YukE
MAVALTPSQFTVDLDELENAIGTVQTHSDIISGNCQGITAVMQALPGYWITPAGSAFSAVAEACTTQMNALSALLGEMVRRMQAAHQTYLTMEQTNFGNLQGQNLATGGSSPSADYAAPAPGQLPAPADHVAPAPGQLPAPADHAVPPADHAVPPADHAVPPADHAVPPADHAAAPARPGHRPAPADHAVPPADHAAAPARPGHRPAPADRSVRGAGGRGGSRARSVREAGRPAPGDEAKSSHEEAP